MANPLSPQYIYIHKQNIHIHKDLSDIIEKNSKIELKKTLWCYLIFSRVCNSSEVYQLTKRQYSSVFLYKLYTPICMLQALHVILPFDVPPPSSIYSPLYFLQLHFLHLTSSSPPSLSPPHTTFSFIYFPLYRSMNNINSGNSCHLCCSTPLRFYPPLTSSNYLLLHLPPQPSHHPASHLTRLRIHRYTESTNSHFEKRSIIQYKTHKDTGIFLVKYTDEHIHCLSYPDSSTMH